MANATPHDSARYQALYGAILEEAASAGAALMERLVGACDLALHARAKDSGDLRLREQLLQSVRLLQAQRSALCAAYPQALRQRFAQVQQSAPAPAPAAAPDLHFEQLELMDELQVQQSVTAARVQHAALLMADASLAELTALVCSTLGLPTVQPERNPLRPEVYVAALQQVIEQLPVPLALRLDWLGSMSAAMGQELRRLYQSLAARLRTQGVAAAAYALHPTGSAAAGHGVPAAPARAPTPHGGAGEAVVLTLDMLRSLLAGELEGSAAASPREAFAQRFAQEFEHSLPPLPQPSFQPTVPAALEALRDMQQVDHMVQRLQQRQIWGLAASEGAAPDGVAAQRQTLRANARNAAQALSLEVVTLMVDSMVHDARLLAPLQRLIARMEPALLRLALADPRFFSDKEHPARALLQEITQRSLAYTDVHAPGFAPFLAELEQVLAPLCTQEVRDRAPFEQALGELGAAWSRRDHALGPQRAQAMQVLQHAEQRHLLAQKIAAEIELQNGAGEVPAVVMDFLCGPWAQVLAQARLSGGARSSAADKYQALISALLWSAHPLLARQNTGKLMRLIPRLLATLREGLETIHYPATRSSAFLEVLVGLHQEAFRAAQTPAVSPAVPDVPVRSARAAAEQDPWMAPQEVQASNFMAFSEVTVEPDAPAAPDAPEPAPAPAPAAGVDLPAHDPFAVGVWVELCLHGNWQRWQLTWASPHATLFLFTGAGGATQSLTQRTRERLQAEGKLRLVAAQPVLDSALDAVAHEALRNSLKSD